ncbi:hypothetical protein SLEP1_g51865 [Rubroshorea leprosula]|uniref:Uncharacterized protein n=1 Tax=Rubroshorea leprosula TaxID=152421 RepID=A0AAV5M4J5_9ROSI|nr:hypothetical protein SLEP1_g51865 [Rubroshorea leprosula]
MYKHSKLQINVIYGTPGIVQEYNVTTTCKLRNLGKLVRIQHQCSLSPTHVVCFTCCFLLRNIPNPQIMKMMII